MVDILGWKIRVLDVTQARTRLCGVRPGALSVMHQHTRKTPAFCAPRVQGERCGSEGAQRKLPAPYARQASTHIILLGVPCALIVRQVPISPVMRATRALRVPPGKLAR